MNTHQPPAPRQRPRRRPGRSQGLIVGRSERGSVVVEVVILAPALGLLLMLIIAGGRVAVAHQAVEAAAAAAARSASIARTQAAATAQDTATASLREQGTTCVSAAVTLDTTGFATPVGTPASVGATVTCHLGLPGSLPITATVRSPLDTHRER